MYPWYSCLSYQPIHLHKLFVLLKFSDCTVSILFLEALELQYLAFCLLVAISSIEQNSTYRLSALNCTEALNGSPFFRNHTFRYKGLPSDKVFFC
jgi:hypothetical protein